MDSLPPSRPGSAAGEPPEPGDPRFSPGLPDKSRRVLLVCTANHCRSPLAAAALQEHLKAAGLSDRVSVDSAALRQVMIGCPPSPAMIEIARRRGLELRGLAKWASPELLATSDLVVCMDHEQRELLIEEMSFAGRTVPVRLLLEFAPHCGREEIPDPHGLDLEAHEMVADLIEHGIRGLVGALARGIDTPPGPAGAR